MALHESSPDSAADNALARQMIRLRWWAVVFSNLLGDSAGAWHLGALVLVVTGPHSAGDGPRPVRAGSRLALGL